jgi:hypothetical protein
MSNTINGISHVDADDERDPPQARLHLVRLRPVPRRGL